MTRAKILLIEDEIDLARLFEHALKRDGHLLRRAGDAAAGLAAVRQWRPDLVLLDVVLQGMNGFEFLELLRKESRVHVMFISGKRRPADLVLGGASGADDYLVKPFTLDVLRARVNLVLSRGLGSPAARKSGRARRRARLSSPR